MAEQFTVAEVFKSYVQDVGLDPASGRRTKSPWKYDPVPRELADSKVEIRVFNVSPIPRTCFMGSLGNKYIAACPAGQPYIKVAEIKKFTIDWSDMGDYNHKPLFIEAEELANCMISPEPNDESDLRRWGVFWTRNETPTDEEISQARSRLFNTYDQLVKKADALYSAGKAREITAIYKLAAGQLKIERPWSQVIVERDLCPACQKPFDKGIAKHDCGAILDWKKALQYRIVTKDQYAEAVADGLVPGEKHEHKVAPLAK